MADKIARQKERGIQIETLRTMIIGIPNAGKSTLMNRLAGKRLLLLETSQGSQKVNNGLKPIKTWKSWIHRGFSGLSLRMKLLHLSWH